MVKKDKRIRDTAGDRALYIAVGAIFLLFVLLVLYPIVFVISASFSSGSALNAGRVVLWPVEPGLQGYKAVFSHRMVLLGYRNTIFYTVAGTAINVVITPGAEIRPRKRVSRQQRNNHVDRRTGHRVKNCVAVAQQYHAVRKHRFVSLQSRFHRPKHHAPCIERRTRGKRRRNHKHNGI